MKEETTLKDFVLSEGISLFGVAKIEDIKKNFLISEEIISSLKYGVCVGYRLSQKILDTIVDRPNKIYFFHYRVVNNLLDHIALRITSYIQERGYSALPVAASQIIDWEENRGLVSHKEIAYLAGLGYRGRNNLLVSPKYGSQIRLVTILTDMPLVVDSPIKDTCGDCKKCKEVCPAGAISEDAEKFDKDKCFEQLKKFSKQENLSQYICGLCVKVCNGRKNDIKRILS